MNEEELYNLEVELINKHSKIFGDVKPRKVRLYKKTSYIGMASPSILRLSKSFIEKSSKKEIIRLLLHEINHYACPNEGHSDKFLDNLDKLGLIFSDYENKCNYEEGIVFNKKIEVLKKENGEIYSEIVNLKKPDWKSFEDLLTRTPNYQGTLFQILRKRKNKTIARVSKATGINGDIIKEIEKSKEVLWVKGNNPTNPFEEKYPEKLLQKLYSYVW